MRARALSLFITSVSLAPVFAQFRSFSSARPRVGTNFPSNYSSSTSINYQRAQSSLETDDTQKPTLEFLNPKGIRITIPGPYPESQQTVLKFYININREFNQVRRGEYEKEVQVPRGGAWDYTFPDIQWRPEDVIYFWIEVEGRSQTQKWIIQFKGTRHVPYSNTNVFSSLDLYSTTPTLIVEKLGDCRPSLTVFNGGQKTCVGENFIDAFRFHSVEYLSNYEVGDKPEESFTVFSHNNVIWDGPTFKMFPSLLEDQYGPYAVNRKITLSNCTAEGQDLCTSFGRGYLINPPILSGRQTTKNTLSFSYGVLHVTAKLPKGDWIVPELWLVPKNQGYSNSAGRIVLARSRGNNQLTDGVKDYSNRVLEAGIEYSNGKETMFKKVQDKPWSDGFHKFKLIWTKDRLEFYVDSEEIGAVHLDASSTSKLEPFNEECYLVFGVHVGGDKDFPDNLVGKPWENYEPRNKLNFLEDRTNWKKTWTGDEYLKISALYLSPLEN